MIGKLFKGKDESPEGRGSRERVKLFETVHAKADQVGSAVLVTVLTEQVTEREAEIILDEASRALNESGSCRLAMDFAHVTILTSPGISTLIQLQKKTSEGKGKIALAGLNEDIQGVMTLTRMDRLLNPKTTTDEALDFVLKR